MKHHVFLVMFLVFGLIGAIRVNTQSPRDGMFFIHVNVKNDGTKNLEDLKARVYFYELGVLLQSSPFDLNNGDTDGKFISWNAPERVKPGDYLARITVSNDDVRKVRHRYIALG